MANTFSLTLKAQNNHPASTVVGAVTHQVPDQIPREQSLSSVAWEVTGSGAINTLAIATSNTVTTQLSGSSAITAIDPITGSNLTFNYHRGLFITCARADSATAPTVGADSIASTTSLAIGTGSKAFTVASGLSITDGARYRAVSATGSGANFMEGIVTYSGTTLTMTSAITGGSGTLADWTLYALPAATITATGFGYSSTMTTALYEGMSSALYIDNSATISSVLRASYKAKVSTDTVVVNLAGTTGLKVSVLALGTATA